jgi:hypothetical protein
MDGCFAGFPGHSSKVGTFASLWVNLFTFAAIARLGFFLSADLLGVDRRGKSQFSAPHL